MNIAVNISDHESRIYNGVRMIMRAYYREYERNVRIQCRGWEI